MTKPFSSAEIVAARTVTATSRRDGNDHPRVAEPPARDQSDLIGRLYDAAVVPALWAGTLSDVSNFVGGHGAALLSKEPANAMASLHVQDGGIEPERVNDYFGTYVRMDMHSLAHCTGEMGQAIVSSEIAKPEDLKGTRFHDEWIAPQGLVDFVNVPLERSSAGTSMFGVFRREEQGLADAAMIRRVELLGPHLRRAAMTSRSMQEATAASANLRETLDSLAAGVFLLDDDGRLVHANASGQRMLRDRKVVDLRSRRLAPLDESRARTFQGAAARVAQGEALVDSGEIALDGKDGNAYLAQVLPLASGERRLASSSQGAAAAVFVRPAADTSPGVLPALVQRYDLTPSELRVLVALAEVGGVPEVSESLGVAVSTVKTHVHRLMFKTGAARQADLVKLLVGWTSRLLR